MKYGIVTLLLLFFITVGAASAAPSQPKPNTVTMIDLGAKSCVPCKMLAPILEKLEKEYQGKADVVFIDVWQNPDAGHKYGIKLIPTQIFYNKKGEEVARHEGFMDENAIRERLDKLLAE